MNDLDDLADDDRDHLLDTAAAIATDGGPLDSNVNLVSDSIFSSYLIPFEAISVLLTAALIGAIVIARKE